MGVSAEDSTLGIPMEALEHHHMSNREFEYERFRRRSLAQLQANGGFLYVLQKDAKPKTMKDRLIKYGYSQKGREMSMGSSLAYTATLVVVAFAIIISKVLPVESVQLAQTHMFFYVMYSLSLVGISYLLILGATGKLSKDNHYKKRGKSNFLRGGLVVLGTGAVIYHFLVVITYVSSDPACRNTYELVEAMMGSLFTGLQIALLIVYLKVRINRSLYLSNLGRFIMMHVVATNLCVWLDSVVHETEEEIHHLEAEAEGGHYNILSSSESESPGNDTACNNISVVTTLTPYLFPLMIEFCVMASTMCLAIWENCGVGMNEHEHESSTSGSVPPTRTGSSNSLHGQSESSDGQTSAATTTLKSEEDYQKERCDFPDNNGTLSKYYNSNLGFILGWMVVVSSVVLIVYMLYVFYSDNDDALIYGTVDFPIYLGNTLTSLVCLIAIPITTKAMTQLTWKDQDIKDIRKELKGHHEEENLSSRFKGIHKQIDKSLMFNTYLCMFAYKILCMIAAYAFRSWMMFIDGLVCIIMGLLQVIFINWFGMAKRSLLREHRFLKPGRQGLEVLRCANLALWLLNTFLLKNIEAKSAQYDAYGTVTFAIMGNITQPLNILFYFHSMVCIGEVITHAYSCKYVGLRTPTKKRVASSKSANGNNADGAKS